VVVLSEPVAVSLELVLVVVVLGLRDPDRILVVPVELVVLPVHPVHLVALLFSWWP
jgi:hypothetical protein